MNAHRVALGLPPFRVIRPVIEQTIAAPKAPLIAATEAELDALITGFSGTKTGLMTIACAGWLLTRNVLNRPLDRALVARFYNIIQRGQWQNTSEPIIVSSSGELNDGQHRLTAIVETGVAVEVDVRFGIDRAAFAATNSGLRRNAGHVLHILGEQHSVPQAAVARLLFLYDRGRIGATAGRVVETSDIVATLNANPDIREAAAFMVHSRFAPTRTAPFGFLLVAAARVSTWAKAAEFGDAVSSGRADDGDPSRALHVRLRDMRMRQKSLNSAEMAVLNVRAWNAWITGKVVQLRLEKVDLAPGNFPQVIGP